MDLLYWLGAVFVVILLVVSVGNRGASCRHFLLLRKTGRSRDAAIGREKELRCRTCGHVVWTPESTSTWGIGVRSPPYLFGDRFAHWFDDRFGDWFDGGNGDGENGGGGNGNGGNGD